MNITCTYINIINICIYIYIYIYICIYKRKKSLYLQIKKERKMHMCIYIYIYIYICKGSLKLHLQKVHCPEDAKSAYKKLAPVESLFLGSAVLPKPTRTHLPATRGQPVPRFPLDCPADSCFREESMPAEDSSIYMYTYIICI